MKNTTISLDESVLEEARAYSLKLGLSFNAWIKKLIQDAMGDRAENQMRSLMLLAKRAGEIPKAKNGVEMKFMKDNIFIDSNIFIYSLDGADKEKQKKTQEILIAATKERAIFISTQVINEVYAVATRKLGADPITMKAFIKGLSEFNVISITASAIDAAIDCSILNRVNYWDALMLAAASEGRCAELWTEDMQGHSVLLGVKILNPFLTT